VSCCAASTNFASATIAFAPSLWLLPACAALPWATTVIAPTPLRRVMIMSFARPDSKTSAQAAPWASVRRCAAEPGDPTSSSATQTTITGSCASAPTSSSAPSVAWITESPPFMSSAPGPIARPPSSRQPSKWPGGNTVSWWPISRIGAPGAAVRHTRWSPNPPSPGMTVHASEGNANASRSCAPTAFTPATFVV
jgi:hypothetical protein